MNRKKIATVCVLTVLTAVACAMVIFALVRKTASIPYSDRFSSNHAEEWTAYGGSWRLKDGSIVNRSDERGAKVVTGGADWSDYAISADMMILGHGGDVGIIARVNEPEIGINAYKGYYVGIRAQDQALVMGVADHDWIETRPVLVRGGVRQLVWYRLQVVVLGCEIAAHLENLEIHEDTWAAMHAETCFGKGKIGLRSLNTGAAYRNIHVVKATTADFTRIARQAPPITQERYPFRETDYARMRQSYYERFDLLLDSLLGSPGGVQEERPADELPITSIHSLEMTHKAEIVRIRGVVTLTEPLYVQDGSGGVQVQLSSPNILNAGDAVELVGMMQDWRRAPFKTNSYRVLWQSNLVTPASISTTQAASGMFDGSFVELSGVLSTWNVSKDGALELIVDDIAQRFTVRVPRGLSDVIPTWWQIGSTVRVRGVCVSGAPELSDSAFLLLLRDASDVEYLSPPPWNQGIRLLILIASGVLVILLWAYAYLRTDRRRMRSILAERELLAAEMHDTLAQSFAGVGYHLQSIRKGLQMNGNVSESLMRKVDIACSMAASTHREASERIVSLQRKRHEDNLLDELHRSATSMLNGAHINIYLKQSGTPVRLPQVIYDTLMRIGEEAVANIFRHSQAAEVRLSLEFGKRDVKLLIEDDGLGFDGANTPSGAGRKGMELRARHVNGELLIVSSPGHGSKVMVRVPYQGSARLWAWIMLAWTQLSTRITRNSDPHRRDEEVRDAELQ
jgi:hypothetical protein